MPSSRTPYGGLPGNASEPDSNRPLGRPMGEDPPSVGTVSDDEEDGRTEGVDVQVSHLDPSKADDGAKKRREAAAAPAKPEKSAPKAAAGGNASLIAMGE